MRDNVLHQALEAYTTDAASQLALEASRGEEIPFELMEAEGRRGKPALYCYRPLTEEFIDGRVGVLTGLTSYAPAARALADHDRLAAYLRLQGVSPAPSEARQQADEALRLFLGRVFADRDEFEFDRARFEPAYEELERTLLEGRCTTMVIAPVMGIALDPTTPELQLADGLALTTADRLPDAPADAVWGDSEEPQVLATLTTTDERGDPPRLTSAVARFRKLLTALRLFEKGTYALGSMAWTRIDSGPWQPVALGATTRPRSLTIIPARQEDELRAFCSLIPRRLPDDGEVAWALARFEMGCEQPSRFQALTDYLMALRVLLEPEGPASGRLAQRLAMICARPEHRARLAERAARAISLERAVIAGLSVSHGEARELVDEISEHLRALLRDTLCGHLAPDLVGVADGLLEREAQAAEAEAGPLGDTPAAAEVAVEEVPEVEEEEPAVEDETAASAPDEEPAASEPEVAHGYVEPSDDAEPMPDPEPIGAPA